jgi:dTDP-4-dehydrorhamnose 3,5-epimerase
MIFTETKLAGAYIIDLEKRGDSRGFFARSFCQDEFEKHGLVSKVVQTNVSLSKHQGTLRGMHYQESPYAETKLVRCTQGAIYDVIVDIRPESPTFKQWIGVELTSSNHRMLFVPQHFAHGFITLMDDSEVTYQVSQVYHPGSERGLRYNDPALGIVWPQAVNVISDKDAAWPDMKP